jgi:hypothetical protein
LEHGFRGKDLRVGDASTNSRNSRADLEGAILAGVLRLAAEKDAEAGEDANADAAAEADVDAEVEVEVGVEVEVEE